MLHVTVDLLRNRLYLTLGWIQKNKIKDAMPAIEKATSKLSPGFSCITRIIDTRKADTADMAEIKKIQQYLISRGMSRVVRVGAEPGKKLFRLLGKDFQSISHDAATLEEAENLLDTALAEDSANSSARLSADRKQASS